MALFKIFKGDSGRLETNRPQRQEGFIYLTEDDMKFYIDVQTSTNTTATTLTQAEREYRQPLNASKADLLQSWETNPSDAAGTWTVNIPGITNAKLIDGLTIRIRIMTSYDSSYNTLNVNGLGAKLVYFRYNTLLTSHLPQYAEMVLTYRTAHNVGSTTYTGASANSRTYNGTNYGTDGWVLDSSYSDGNTYDRLLNSAEMRRVGVELTRQKLCMLDENGWLQPISIGNTTGSTKTANTVPLQLSRVIYYSSTSTVAAKNAVAQNTLYEDVPFNPAYTINTTVGNYSDLYLVGTLNNKGYFVLDNTNTTSFYKIVVEPSSSTLSNNTFIKGKYYLYIGSSRNADNLVHLMPHNQLYYCNDDNGKQLIPILPMAASTLSNLEDSFIQTTTTGTESGKITINGVTTSILYGRPESVTWIGSDSELKFKIVNTDTSQVTSLAMPTLKVAWGGTGRTTLTAGKALIGDGTNAVAFRDIYTKTAVGTLDWNSASNEYLITKGALAYWNGAYSGTSSNLTYCVKGKFGSIITIDKGDFAANTMVYAVSTTKIQSAALVYTTGANLAVNKPNITTGYTFEVNGKSRMDGLVIHTNNIGIITGDTDKFINWYYNTNETAGASWRLGVLGTGTGDANYFTLESGTSTTSATTWNSVFKFGQNTFDASFAKNVLPYVTNEQSLGTEDLKWKTVYATNFIGGGSSIEDLNADKVTSGILKVPRGGTGTSSFTKYAVLYGNGNSTLQAAGSVMTDGSHLSVGQNSVDTNYVLKVVGTSYFSGNITMLPGGTPTSYPWTSNKIIFNGGTDGADIYYSVNSADAGRLWLNTRDDANCLIALGYNGTAKAYFATATPSFYPATTNTGSIGTSSNRWAHLYVGSADSYGNNTKPIYWNDGVPAAMSATIGSSTKPVYINGGVITPIDYDFSAAIKTGTKNRIAYYSNTTEISSAASLYVTDTELSINKTSAPANSGKFQVVGTSTMQAILPEATNTYALGSSTLRWSKLYVGTADTYGNNTKPIYWNDGIPTALSSTVGGTEQPIYINSGTLTKTTYALKATVNNGTANRMTYYSGDRALSAATSIYATTDSLTINGTAAPANSGKFQVIGTSTMRAIYPEATNSYALGSSSLRWSKLYLGTADGYGSNTKFIYWNDGLPVASSATVGGGEQPIYLNSGTFTATTYALKATVNNGTANRMAYYSGERAISAAASMYATGTVLSINKTSAPANSGNFQVVGVSTMRHIYPETTNTYTLGSSSLRWKAVYIGTADSYGNNTKPIYWNGGIPTALSCTVGTSERGVYFNSGTITAVTWYPHSCSITSSNKSNFPWHRVATCNMGTGSWVDKSVILVIHQRFNGGFYGIIKLTARCDNATTSPRGACSIGANWLCRIGIAENAIRICKKGLAGESNQIDVYIKVGTYARAIAYELEGSNLGWTLISSNEVADTTASNKKTSTEVWTDITNSSGATAYDTIQSAADAGYVAGLSDSKDGVNITATYNTDALTSTSWFTIWNGTVLQKISPANGLKSMIGSAIGNNTKFVYWDGDKFAASTATVGSGEQPVFLSSGTITKTTYALKATVNDGAANRMAYYSAARAISQASSIYASTTAITINGTSAPANSGNFQVIGTSTMRQIRPETNNSYTLGVSGTRWSKVYIGSADTYGNNTKPIYWNDGIPTPFSSTIGSASKPVWCDSGTFKEVTLTDLADALFKITTITKSLKLTQTWQDTGIASNNIPDTGTYIIQVMINGAGTSGTSNQYSEYYSGVMSWFSTATNSSDADEILLHKAGHASQGQNLYLRTVRGPSGTLKLQYKFTSDKTATENVQFKFRKMI